MQESAQVQDFVPPKASLSKPAHEDWRQGAATHKCQVHGGRLVVVVTQLDSAEEDHVADDAEEGEPLAQLS